MIRTILILSLMMILFSSCFRKAFEEGRKDLFENFELINSTTDLTEGEGANWSFLQITESENFIEIDSSNPAEGSQCLKFSALPSLNGSASKCGLANNDMFLDEGELFTFSAEYYIEGEADLTDIFLFDIEESATIGAGPGIRIELESEEGYLKVERKKMIEDDISQNDETKVVFPRNQWCKLGIEMLLSQKKDGYIKVFQDDVLLIHSEDIRTLPVDKLNFIQGTKGIYNSIQVGITANSPENSAVIYVDDIRIN